MSNGDRDAYGRIVKARRVQLGLTQDQLAQRVGKARSYLAQLETGRIQVPEAAFRARLADALGYTDGELLKLAGYARAPEETATPEEVARMIAGEMVPIEPVLTDPRKRLEELLPLLDERQARYLAVHVEFVLGLRD